MTEFQGLRKYLMLKIRSIEYAVGIFPCLDVAVKSTYESCFTPDISNRLRNRNSAQAAKHPTIKIHAETS